MSSQVPSLKKCNMNHNTETIRLLPNEYYTRFVAQRLAFFGNGSRSLSLRILLLTTLLSVALPVLGQQNHESSRYDTERAGQGQKLSGALQQEKFDPSLIVAKFGKHTIQAGDVDFHLNRTVNLDSLQGEVLKQARATALEYLINRAAVLDTICQKETWPGDSKIKIQEEATIANLNKVKETLERYLTSKGISMDFWHSENAWQVGWPIYLENVWTEEKLNSYFKEHQRDFDGSQLNVAQILFAVPKSNDVESVLQLATRTKSEIEQGKITFTDAVANHSIGPSKEKLGELGWIRRHEPMPEDFSQVAFGLDASELAEPFVSQFGVHLIKCLEVKAGKKMFGDARADVLKAAAHVEFQSIAKHSRLTLAIEYEKSFPHFSKQ